MDPVVSKTIQQAFELLSDPVARAAYDRAPGILIEPASVNFGVLESGQPGVGAEVTVSWTGAPPGRIKSDPGGDWWTNRRAAMPDPSCVVFFLQAQAVAGTPNGRRDDRFTVTLDEMTVVVDLTAEIRGVPAPAPPPTFATARRVPPAPRPATGSPGCALAFGLTEKTWSTPRYFLAPTFLTRTACRHSPRRFHLAP
jgi:hypothetical protein